MPSIYPSVTPTLGSSLTPLTASPTDVPSPIPTLIPSDSLNPTGIPIENNGRTTSQPSPDSVLPTSAREVTEIPSMEPTLIIVDATLSPSSMSSNRIVSFESLLAIGNISEAITTLNINCRNSLDITVDTVLHLPVGSTSYLSDSSLTPPRGAGSRNRRVSDVGDSKTTLACHLTTEFPLTVFPQFDDPWALFYQMRKNLTETVADGRFITEFRHQLLLRGEDIGKVVTIMFGNVTSVNLHVYDSPVSTPTGTIYSDSRNKPAPLATISIVIGVVASVFLIALLFVILLRQYTKYHNLRKRDILMSWAESTGSKGNNVKWMDSWSHNKSLLFTAGDGPDILHAVGDKKISYLYGEYPDLLWMRDHPKSISSGKDSEFIQAGRSKVDSDEVPKIDRPYLFSEASRGNHVNSESNYGEFDFVDTFRLNNLDVYEVNGRKKKRAKVPVADADTKTWPTVSTAAEISDKWRKVSARKGENNHKNISGSLDFSYTSKSEEFEGNPGRREPDRSQSLSSSGSADEFSHNLCRKPSNFMATNIAALKNDSDTVFSHDINRKSSTFLIEYVAQWIRKPFVEESNHTNSRAGDAFNWSFFDRKRKDELLWIDAPNNSRNPHPASSNPTEDTTRRHHCSENPKYV